MCMHKYVLLQTIYESLYDKNLICLKFVDLYETRYQDCWLAVLCLFSHHHLYKSSHQRIQVCGAFCPKMQSKSTNSYLGQEVCVFQFSDLKRVGWYGRLELKFYLILIFICILMYLRICLSFS